MWRWMVIVLSVLALAVTSSAQDDLDALLAGLGDDDTPALEEAVDTAAEALTEENVEDPFADLLSDIAEPLAEEPRKR